jgi:hypothetical protein
MSQLVYSEEELMRSHEYAMPHIEAGHRLHGGFDAAGSYIPPRCLVREPAIAAWSQALRSRGGDWLAADSSLLAGVRYPSPEQNRLLLEEGLGQTFWNTLTITGKIEARGRLLAEITFPDFQDLVAEDISQMAIGHLGKGLLVAHGIDEGGEPDKGIGGHDVMWFALRDLAFGETNFPDPEVPDNIGRPEEEATRISQIPLAFERTIYFLLNLLLIEFRAERGFAMTEAMLRDPDLFKQRRDEALHAALIVDRIRKDEEIHVSSLRLYLGELRSVRFESTKGGSISGAEVVDSLWREIVRWAVVEQPRLLADQQRKMMTERILGHAEGERILARFHALEEVA